MGRVIVVQGDAGMGKSRLLTEIFALAHDRGARVGGSVADPSESVVELSALLAALCQGTDPLLDPHGLDGLERLPGQRFWLLRDVQGLLERAAMASPLLIGIDDAQWADGGTAAALRTLPAQLAGLPIAWVLATRPMSTWTPMTRAIDELQRAGGVTVSLGPLGTAAAAEVCRELLGAEPDDEVLRLVEEAGGSPFLLVEMLLGLQEDSLVRVEGGRAELIERCLPHRMEDQMRERLGRLSEAAGNAAIVAASLGRTFSFGDLALTI